VRWKDFLDDFVEGGLEGSGVVVSAGCEGAEEGTSSSGSVNKWEISSTCKCLEPTPWSALTGFGHFIGFRGSNLNG